MPPTGSSAASSASAVVPKARALLQQSIRSFLYKSGGPPYLILDTRSRSAYRRRHVVPSTNIPVENCDQAWFQLPPRHTTPFALIEDVEPDGGENEETAGQEEPETIEDNGHVNTQQQQQGSPNNKQKKEAETSTVPNKRRKRGQGFEDSSTPFQSSQISTTEILRGRGWKVDWVFHDHPHFWSVLKEELETTEFKEYAKQKLDALDPPSPFPSALHISENQTEKKEQEMGNTVTTPLLDPEYHFLFQPNPALVKALPRIEQDLLTMYRHRIASTDTAAQEKSLPLLRCLDIGCGSGRDMTYMVSRHANNVSTDSAAQWSAVGIDIREDSCERSMHLAHETFVPDGRRPYLADRVSTIVGEIDSKTGVLQVHRQYLYQASSSESQEQSSPPSRVLDLPNVEYLEPSPTLQQETLPATDSLAATAESLASESTSVSTALSKPCQSRDDRFDLVVIIRFLQRSLFPPLIKHWIRPGGFLLLSTFVTDKDLPHYTKPGPEHRLQSRTEAREIMEGLGMEVIMEEVSLIEDGKRSVATVVARKPVA